MIFSLFEYITAIMATISIQFVDRAAEFQRADVDKYFHAVPTVAIYRADEFADALRLLDEVYVQHNIARVPALHGRRDILSAFKFKFAGATTPPVFCEKCAQNRYFDACTSTACLHAAVLECVSGFGSCACRHGNSAIIPRQCNCSNSYLSRCYDVLEFTRWARDSNGIGRFRIACALGFPAEVLWAALEDRMGTPWDATDIKFADYLVHRAYYPINFGEQFAATCIIRVLRYCTDATACTLVRGVGRTYQFNKQTRELLRACAVKFARTATAKLL